MNNGGIIIRKATREDYKEIVDVMNSETSLWNADVFLEWELEILKAGKDTVEDLISGEDRNRYLVVIVDGLIVGFLSWRTKPNNVGWVNRSVTLPGYQRRGIGRQLNLEVERQAKEMGLAALAKETQKKATWAVQFHLSNGYKLLTNTEAEQPPFKGTLSKPIADDAPYCVFGKKAKDFLKGLNQ